MNPEIRALAKQIWNMNAIDFADLPILARKNGELVMCFTSRERINPDTSHVLSDIIYQDEHRETFLVLELIGSTSIEHPIPGLSVPVEDELYDQFYDAWIEFADTDEQQRLRKAIVSVNRLAMGLKSID